MQLFDLAPRHPHHPHDGSQDFAWTRMRPLHPHRWTLPTMGVGGGDGVIPNPLRKLSVREIYKRELNDPITSTTPIIGRSRVWMKCST
jgi:hypothetical protein